MVRPEGLRWSSETVNQTINRGCRVLAIPEATWYLDRLRITQRGNRDRRTADGPAEIHTFRGDSTMSIFVGEALVGGFAVPAGGGFRIRRPALPAPDSLQEVRDFMARTIWHGPSGLYAGAAGSGFFSGMGL